MVNGVPPLDTIDSIMKYNDDDTDVTTEMINELQRKVKHLDQVKSSIYVLISEAPNQDIRYIK